MTQRRDGKRDGSGAPGSALTVRTLAVVTIVTLLTWLLAESQTVQRRTLTMEVRLDPGGEQRAVRLVPGSGWDRLVEVSIDGAAANLEAVRRAARAGVTLTVGDELAAEPGVRLVDLREALRNDAVFAGSGVSIGEASPARIEVEVRAVSEVLLPVEVGLPPGSEAEVTVVDPAAVAVVGPESVVSLLGDRVLADVPPALVEGLLPGQSVDRVNLPVRIGSPEEPGSLWGVRVRPERVSVSVTVRSRVETAVLPSVPVQVLLAPSELDRWVIEVAAEDRDIRDVRVTGPTAQLDRILSGEVPVVAVVRLSFEELERGVTYKEAELPTLPGGLRAESDDLTVSLTVRRREAGVGGAGGAGSGAASTDE